MHLNIQAVKMFQFKYPKTLNVFSSVSIPQIKTAISSNSLWNVSQKLDGTAIAVSDLGYIASRNLICATNEQIKNVSFQNVGLMKISTIFDKIRMLKQHLNSQCQLNLCEQDEILLYGEFIVNGISTTKYDIYHYSNNNIKTGKMYSFAIGFVFNNSDHLSNKQKLQKHFSNVIELQNEKNQTYFICLINLNNRHHFKACNIDIVPLYPSEKFVNLLTKSKHKFLEKLESRVLEGYIIHDSSNQVFKWKYPINSNQDHLLEELKSSFTTEDEMKIFSAYQLLCQYSKNYITDLNMKEFKKLFDLEMTNKDLIYDDIKKSSNEKFTILRWANEIFIRMSNALKQNEDSLLDKRVIMKMEDLILSKLTYMIKHCL